jgi:hypothetical protein
MSRANFVCPLPYRVEFVPRPFRSGRDNPVRDRLRLSDDKGRYTQKNRQPQPSGGHLRRAGRESEVRFREEIEQRTRDVTGSCGNLRIGFRHD